MSDKPVSTLTQLKALWGHLTPRRRRQLIILGLLMIVGSFAEVVSLGSVLPFLGVLTAPERVFAHPIAQPFIALLGITKPSELFFPVTLSFATAVIASGVFRLLVLWVQTRLSMAIGADFSIQVYERTLNQPYSIHVSRNSSEILAGIRKASDLVYTILQPVLILIGSSLLMIAIISTLIFIDTIIAITAFLGFGLIYTLLVTLTKKRVSKNSSTIATQHNHYTKAIQEGLGGIRDILIDGTQRIYTKLYKEAYRPYMAAASDNQVVNLSPRIGVESLGILLIAVIALFSSYESGGLVSAIPTLGALALGAQRLIPVLQQMYGSWITIKGTQASAQDAIDLLNQPLPAENLNTAASPILFEKALILKNISFRYNEQSPWILKDLKLEISKGSRVGFMGVTGSGKTTLLDIVMGLLPPTEGQLIVDRNPLNEHNLRSWQAHISHVPQTIYLADTTIAENIAFGVPFEQIDRKRMKEAAQMAQISETIEGWTKGYETIVGERGIRLSGGQRQRIGIARALYKRSSVIILDEATSALDIETEAAVIKAIEKLADDITIMIITHRLTTLNNCDRILEVKDGQIREINFHLLEQMIN